MFINSGSFLAKPGTWLGNYHSRDTSALSLLVNLLLPELELILKKKQTGWAKTVNKKL